MRLSPYSTEEPLTPPPSPPMGLPLLALSGDRLARQVADWACDAMLQEVSLELKPGLVCPQHNGAHQDMNYQTFLASIDALRPYFATTTYIGLQTHTQEPQAVMPLLRRAGLQAETAMYAATHGVNTHKGLIFSLGLLTAAYGRLTRSALSPPTAAQLTQQAADWVGNLVAERLIPLRTTRPLRPLTAGEQLYLRYGVTGIQGEAEAGFPSALRALNRLRSLFCSHSPDEALGQTLLHLMASTTDTNILWRRGLAGLYYVQASARQALTEGGLLTAPGHQRVLSMQAAFTHARLSPGGCADLLAIAIFLHLVTPQAERL